MVALEIQGHDRLPMSGIAEASLHSPPSNYGHYGCSYPLRSTRQRKSLVRYGNRTLDGDITGVGTLQNAIGVPPVNMKKAGDLGGMAYDLAF